jgi:hypothetical protein
VSGFLTAAAGKLSGATEAASTAADVVDFVASGASAMAGDGSAAGAVAEAVGGLAGLVGSVAGSVDSITSSVEELHSGAQVQQQRLQQEEQAIAATPQHWSLHPPWNLQEAINFTSISWFATAVKHLANHVPEAAVAVLSQVRASMEALMAAHAWLPILVSQWLPILVRLSGPLAQAWVPRHFSYSQCDISYPHAVSATVEWLHMSVPCGWDLPVNLMGTKSISNISITCSSLVCCPTTGHSHHGSRVPHTMALPPAAGTSSVISKKRCQYQQ